MLDNRTGYSYSLEEYVFRGEAFQISRRAALESGEVVYIVLDTTALIGDKLRLLLPQFQFKTSGGEIYVDMYPITSYSGGTEIKFAHTNMLVPSDAKSVFKYGITPVGVPGNELRQHIIGTEITNQSSGGNDGALYDITKVYVPGTILAVKVENIEDEEIHFEYGIIICETD